METTNPLQAISHEASEPPVVATSSAALVMDAQSMERMEYLAKTMASGKCTVPKHLQNSPGDCLAVIMQSIQWQMNPFSVAQKTHLSPSGQLGYEAQLINAVVISRAPVIGRPEYEFLGDWKKILGKITEKTGTNGGKYYAPNWKDVDEEGLGVICRVHFIGEAAPREITVMMSQCYPRFSTQWATDPQQQICYVAIRKFSRRHCPDVILGVYTPEELEEDYSPVERELNPGGSSNKGAPKGNVIDPAQDARRATLIAGLETAAKNGEAAFVAEWKRMGKANKNDIYLVGESEYVRLLNVALAAQPPEKTVQEEPVSASASDFVADMDAAEKATQQ
jgi:hypothetical protein